jgi:hypothetical protein
MTLCRAHVDTHKLYDMFKAGRIVNWHWQPKFSRPQVLHDLKTEVEEVQLLLELQEIFQSDIELIDWPADGPIPEPFALYTGQKR